MRTLLTGGTGFIGSAVARRLLLLGRPVTVIARAPVRAGRLKELGATVIAGDVRDSASIRRAIEGCGSVVHAAGVPRPATWSTFRAVHVGGTAAVVQASRNAGIKRLVNIASQAVLFGGKDLLNVDESCPYPKRYIDPYSATKAQAERLVLAANDPAGLSTISLRPAVVWGPGDSTVLPIMARLALSPMGVPMCGDGSNVEATTYIENLVDAVIAALDAPPFLVSGPGRAYLITDGFTISWKEFLSRQLEAAGIRPRFRRIPALLAEPSAWMLDMLAGAIHAPVPLALFGVRSSMTSRRFVTSRARDELGYVPRVGLDDGLKNLREWVDHLGGPSGLIRARDLALQAGGDAVTPRHSAPRRF